MKKVVRGFVSAAVGFAIIFLFVFSVRLFFIVPSLSGYYAVFVFIGAVFMLATETYAMYKLGRMW